MALPNVDELVVTNGYDERLKKPFIVVNYETTAVREYLPEKFDALDDEAKKLAMRHVVGRCMHRLTIIEGRRRARAIAKKVMKRG